MSKTFSLWLAIKRKLTVKKISNNLVTLSSAAILAVYAAGYERTKPAADRFELQAVRQIAAVPVAAIAGVPAAPLSPLEAFSTRSASPAPAPRAATVVPDAAAPAPTENLTVP